MKKLVLIIFLAVSGAGYAKPAHVFYHVGKGIVHPVRHPHRVAHDLWKVMTAVF